MSRDRKRLLLALAAAVLIVAGGWLVRAMVDPTDETPALPPPPSAPPEGYRWVGSGHVVIGIPQDWESDDTGCEAPPCNRGGEGERRSTVSISYTAEDEVSPQDQSVTLDGTSALRSPIDCDTTGCTGRILVPSEHAVVVVKGVSEDEVAQLLDGVHVLDDLVAVPEIRFAPEPQETDALRFAEWARTLDLDVELRPVEGEVPGQVLGTEPPTGTMVEPGTTVVADVVRPVPEEQDCTSLLLYVRTEAGRKQVYPPKETVRLELGVGDLFSYEVEGSCGGIVTPDISPRAVTRRPGSVVVTWSVAECDTLVPEVAATCGAGEARLGAVVVDVVR